MLIVNKIMGKVEQMQIIEYYCKYEKGVPKCCTPHLGKGEENRGINL